MTERTKYLYARIVKGLPYLFFRFKGKLTPLPVDQKSAEFRRAYDACIKEAAPVAARHMPRRAPINDGVGLLPGTIGAAIDKYLDSTEFDEHPQSTKYVYRQICKQLRERLGSARLADLDTDAVDIHTEQVAKAHGASIADRHMRMISLVWDEVRKYPEFKIKGKSNPTRDAKKRYKVKQKHRPWPRNVQDAFMESAPDHLKLAKILLHFTAQRGGDCIKMKWTDFDGEGIFVRPEKTMGDVDAQPNYHLCPDPLLEALAKAPRVAPTILVNAKGKPYTMASTLGNAIKRELIQLGLAPKSGRVPYVMHGLRKNAASEVASLGFGAAGVKSVGGWRSDEEANYYAAHADKRRVNAMVVEQWNAELARQATADRRAKIRRAK